jgi:copper homeostasis protein (lipoprotein)
MKFDKLGRSDPERTERKKTGRRYERMNMRVAMLALTSLILAGAGALSAGGGEPSATVRGALGAMPATFTGDLPCADCEAIHYHLDLFVDRSFYLRTTYRGKPGGQFDDIGSWSFSSDGKILVFQGGREAPGRF